MAEEDLDKALNRLSNFTHPRIDPRTQTRLLRIAQPTRAPTPTYTLETHNLRDLLSTRYRALSYTWGDASALTTVFVSSQPFAARANLGAFLAAAAARAETGLFFIDAMCINQLDEAERAAQVGAMARIFRCADEVVAWLGAPAESEADGVRALAAAPRGAAPRGAAEWAGLRYLGYHPYWRRVWIVQEVVLARRVAVWCGVFVFPLSVLGGAGSGGGGGDGSSGLRSYCTGLDEKGRPGTYRAAAARAPCPAEVVVTHRLRHVPRPVFDATAQGTRVGTMDEMMADLRRPHTTTKTYQDTTPDLLHHMIRKFGRQECSNPRDRLYGFLGMLAERSRRMVVPDYGRDVRYAFYQALRVGMGEIYGERGGMTDRPRGDNTYLGFYCDARDAFGVGHDESLAVLRAVVSELGFRGKLSEAALEMQMMNQYDLRDFRSGLCPDLKHLLGYVEEEDIPREGLLSRLQQRQRRKVESW